jgi:pSer/pThr/pTyr-binding forkhead associated (FHA) protein
MKLSLKVLTTGKWEGKVIPITLAQFLIGRDPQCHLRPASPIISKRHCAILRRQDKIFLRDFSTNGTSMNGQPVQGEVELQHGDKVKVGPIEFEVQLEASAPAQAKVNEPTPLPVNKSLQPGSVAAAGSVNSNAACGSDDESVANLLLSLVDDGPAPTPSGLAGTIPEGSTVMEVPTMPLEPGQKPPEKPKSAKESTSDAARSLLDKYMRGKRS